MRGVRIAFLAGDRRDVDDAAIALLDHRRHDRFAAEERAVEVDAQHLAPFFVVRVPHRFVDACDAGIVDEDVDLSERLERDVARVFDGGQIRHVDLHGDDALTNLFRCSFREGDVVIPDRDFCT